MRTLSSSLISDLGLTVTRPGYLVEIAFSTTLRLSTLGDISFNGTSWTAADMRVSGLSADGRATQSGSITFANTWADYGVLVLDEGVADRPVRIWVCHAGAPDDAVKVFDGVGDEASFDARGRLTLQLASSAMRSAFWPRRRINAANGFATLMPAGTRLTLGGQPYVIERR